MPLPSLSLVFSQKRKLSFIDFWILESSGADGGGAVCGAQMDLIFFLSRNPECRYLASASKDGSIRIWDTLMGRCDKILTSHTQSVTCVKWGGDGLIYSSSQDRTIKVWRSQDVSEASSPVAGHTLL